MTKKTITVDGNEFCGIGILGYTTSEDLYHEPEAQVFMVSELLDDVLVKGICEEIPFNEDWVWLFKQKDWMRILDSHIEFIENSDSTKKYFDVLKSYPAKRRILRSVLVRVLGAKKSSKVFKFYSNVKNVIREVK